MAGPVDIIYMNTFGKTMAPAIRINYMILPEKEKRYDRTLILNYSDLKEEKMKEAVKRLSKIFE